VTRINFFSKLIARAAWPRVSVTALKNFILIYFPRKIKRYGPTGRGPLNAAEAHSLNAAGLESEREKEFFF